MSTNQYGRDFFRSIDPGAYESAQTVVPMLLSHLGAPLSVIDVGCGSGAWLRVIEELTAADIAGVDGAHAAAHTSVDPLITRDLAAFRSLEDLGSHDWAISLEVAEHLPPERGPTFVGELAALADFVIFSAAVPGQPGTGHINCRRPEYWAGIFADHGFYGTGAARAAIWHRPEVEWWYQQNLMVFAKDPIALGGLDPDGCPYLVHPELYDWALRKRPTVVEGARG